ncbi:hypothetical protein C0J52_09167 [Blattella germanica]|nr:hypothetical protein C0J52_09167 [Blattella germanica]
MFFSPFVIYLEIKSKLTFLGAFAVSRFSSTNDVSIAVATNAVIENDSDDDYVEEMNCLPQLADNCFTNIYKDLDCYFNPQSPPSCKNNNNAETLCRHFMLALSTCNVRATIAARSCQLPQGIITDAIHAFFTNTDCGQEMCLLSSSTIFYKPNISIVLKFSKLRMKNKSTFRVHKNTFISLERQCDERQTFRGEIVIE